MNGVLFYIASVCVVIFLKYRSVAPFATYNTQFYHFDITLSTIAVGMYSTVPIKPLKYEYPFSGVENAHIMMMYTMSCT